MRKSDSEDRTFWRRPTQRLEAEVIRDSLLAVGDRLDLTMFGHSTAQPREPAAQHLSDRPGEQVGADVDGVRRPRRAGRHRQPRHNDRPAPQSLYLLND